MKVFLVYVRDEDFYRLLSPELGGARSGDGRVRVVAFPPIGIETLAPVVRQRGHEVRMFDTCHPRMKEEHIAEAVREERPDVIALSFLSTTSYPATRRMARRLKLAAPDTPIILGGVFATMNAKKILADCLDADFIGRGEGEELLPDFLENLNDPGRVCGLVWRSGDEIVENPPRPIIKDLDRFPYPDRKSLPVDYIESMPLDVPAVLSLDRFCTMQTSRGCPYPCVYCDIPALAGGKWRSRSPEHVLGEMQQLNDEGYRSIYLTDDHFLLNRKRIQEICRGIIDRKLKFRWGCEGRVDSVAIDQFPIMAEASCGFLAFGVEAGTQKVLDRLKKMQTLEQIEHAVDEAKRQGIKMAHGFFLVGSPDETEADILQTFRFAARLKLDTFGFNRLCVYRGTPLWHEYVERGIIDDERDWYKWFKCSDIDPTVLPSEVVNRARKKGYLLLFAHRIFLRPIQTLKLLRTFGWHMKMSDILKLLWSPFRKWTLTLRPELPARLIEQGLTAPPRGAPQEKLLTIFRQDSAVGRFANISCPTGTGTLRSQEHSGWGHLTPKTSRPQEHPVPFGKKLKPNHTWVVAATIAAIFIPVFSHNEPQILSILCMAVGLALRCWSLGQTQSKGTFLATTGPYTYSWNPLYIANIFFAFGLGAATGYVWTTILLLLFAFGASHFRIRKQEIHLRPTHRASLDSYGARLKRWLPKFGAHGQAAARFDWATFYRNHGLATLAAFAAFMLWWDVLDDLILPWLQKGKPIGFLLRHYFRHIV